MFSDIGPIAAALTGIAIGWGWGQRRERKRIYACEIHNLWLRIDELEDQAAKIDELRWAIPPDMTEADIIGICQEYAAYRQRWYEIFGRDPSGLDHPCKTFQEWRPRHATGS